MARFANLSVWMKPKHNSLCLCRVRWKLFMTSTYRFEAHRTMTPNRLFRRFSFDCSKSSMRRRVSQPTNVCRTHYDRLIKLSRKLDLSRPLSTHLAHGKVSFPREKNYATHRISSLMRCTDLRGKNRQRWGQGWSSKWIQTNFSTEFISIKIWFSCCLHKNSASLPAWINSQWWLKQLVTSNSH